MILFHLFLGSLSGMHASLFHRLCRCILILGTLFLMCSIRCLWLSTLCLHLRVTFRVGFEVLPRRSRILWLSAWKERESIRTIRTTRNLCRDQLIEWKVKLLASKIPHRGRIHVGVSCRHREEHRCLRWRKTNKPERSYTWRTDREQ